MTINQPRRSPVEITNPNAVYADSQSRGELRHALAVLMARQRAGKLSAWGLADALIAGPLAPLLAKLAAVEAVDPPEVAVERVARALYAEGAWCGCCDFDGWDTCSACRRIVRGYATTAIAALQPPALNPEEDS